MPLESCGDGELEVLRLVAGGLSNAEIARQLVVGDATAKTHVARIFASSTSTTARKPSCSPTKADSCSPARPHRQADSGLRPDDVDSVERVIARA